MTSLTEVSQPSLRSSKEAFNEPDLKKIVKRSLRYLSSGYPVHFTGPSGVGKTTLALQVAKKQKRPIILISGNTELSNEDLIGAYTGYKRKKLNDNFVRTVHKIEEDISEEWTNGRLYEAVKNGYTVVYDEFTRSKPEVNNLFLSILEENILPLYGTKRTESFLDVHPDFSVIFTSNPNEYTGVYKLQDALLDRIVTIPLHPLNEDTEITIVVNQTNIEEKKAKSIVQFVNEVRSLCDKSMREHSLSLRASLMIAQVVQRYNLKVDGDNEEFQDICLDVTVFPLQRCVQTEELEELENKILEKCKSI
ncbi:gas vesicle protein GvpN [Halobacillus salinarum]|uniref:Gas vesicle protein GvpN n=1 Tax=Halobacillus salinarum TaxID=2932257 RepID=A0ABY4EJW0_9BACI|nr:gas vesicle protein GvpN [Halobacillus salinarum]UOQ44148.1 gas vesicle protein GvpN [Halobacillus salinarum]